MIFIGNLRLLRRASFEDKEVKSEEVSRESIAGFSLRLRLCGYRLKKRPLPVQAINGGATYPDLNLVLFSVFLLPPYPP